MIRRGEVVIVDFYPTDPKARVRPALVVQNDRDNARMARTTVVQITSNVSRAGEDTQHLIDPAHPDWAASGLRLPSVINACNFATVPQGQITHVIGSLSAATMRRGSMTVFERALGCETAGTVAASSPDDHRLFE